tara:strand:+ start:4110 stop:4796 length:687 start_codon:yes stop_codon:yes gene_type:complete
MIVFNEEKHTYVNTETGKHLISATTLIGKYKPKFDSIGNATRVAKREGVSVDFILEEWEREKNRACDYGTKIHKVMEDYLGEGIEEEQYSSFYTSYRKWEDIFKKFPKLTCEMRLNNVDMNIAGTADLIYENGKHFYVGDFKTNKAFRFNSEYNEFFEAPIDHLGVCEFNTYCLQLSLYAYLYELSSGKKCSGLVIFFKNKDNTWYPIRLNYMKQEIIALIADYNNPN